MDDLQNSIIVVDNYSWKMVWYIPILDDVTVIRRLGTVSNDNL